MSLVVNKPVLVYWFSLSIALTRVCCLLKKAEFAACKFSYKLVSRLSVELAPGTQLKIFHGSYVNFLKGLN